MTAAIDLNIRSVVREGNCSGCGACCVLDRNLAMTLDADGFARPVRVGEASSDPRAADRFNEVCPGRLVAGPKGHAPVEHPTMGPAQGTWRAWASDPEIRRRGSSGGVITAISRWLLESARATSVVAAHKRDDDPTRTTTVRVTEASGIVETAGSRYAPASNAAHFDPDEPGGVFVGKPCEVSAARKLWELVGNGDAPLMMSFFCAGTPSQHATDELVESLGNRRRPQNLWYRGEGWPGRFTVVNDDGTTASLSYHESWGQSLGRATQWRCKICPDGVGTLADIVVADFWEADEQGYPVFDEGEGTSFLIARTQRGLELVESAARAGVIHIEPGSLDDLARVQPLQNDRRTALAGRLLGTRLAGRAVPRYRRFGLLVLAARHPVVALRAARGAYRRTRASRSSSGVD